MAASADSAGVPAPPRVGGLAGLACALAQTIVFALGFTHLIAAAGLFAFDALPWAIYPAAVGLAVAASLAQRERLRPEQRSWRLAGTALAVLLLLVVPFLVARWFDGSYDGLGYHQTAIMQLAEGWNPLRGEAPVVVTNERWITHFPKAAWIIGAVLMKCFGTIEAAKAVNLLAVVAAGCLATSLLAQRGMGPGSAILTLAAGIGVAANPVVLAQLFSSYTDGFLVSLLLLSVLASARVALERDFKSMLLLGFSIVLCANTKFTAVVYLGVGLFVLFGLWPLLRREVAMRRVIICWLAALVPGICVLGADPYLKNALRHGHPFYPMLGENSRNTMRVNRPQEYLEMGWTERLARSIFSAPKNTLGGRSAMRPPWIVTREDIFQLANYDLRIGGFGPWFGAALVLSIALLLWMPGFAGPRAMALWGGLVFVVVSVAINPEAWWARYVPQLWWFPWIPIAAVAWAGRAGVARAAALVCALILVLNAGLVAGASTGHAYFHTEKQRALIERLKEGQAGGGAPYHIYFSLYEGIVHRYAAAGIRFVRVTSVAQLPCANPEDLGGPAPVMRMCHGTAAAAGPSGEDRTILQNR